MSSTAPLPRSASRFAQRQALSAKKGCCTRSRSSHRTKREKSGAAPTIAQSSRRRESSPAPKNGVRPVPADCFTPPRALSSRDTQQASTGSELQALKRSEFYVPACSKLSKIHSLRPAERRNACLAAKGCLDSFVGGARHDILEIDASPLRLHAQALSLRALPIALLRESPAACLASAGHLLTSWQR